MSRPSFQFYTKDWRANSKLRRCSAAARGVWIDILCALHDSDEYGIARYSLKELASEVGASLAHVRELVDKAVLKGSDRDGIEPFVYVPRSGRKDGPPVTLLPAQPGPLWYSSRMVKDEYVNTHRGEGTRFGESPNQPPKPAPIRRQGDGPSSASASAPSEKDIAPTGLPDSPTSRPPPVPAPPFTGLNAETLNGKAVVPLAPGWELPEAWGHDSVALGFTPKETLYEAERFRQYFVTKGVRRSVKGWRQSWSNWLAKAAERKR